MNWTAPVFTGGLSSLRYIVTVRTFFDRDTFNASVDSLVVRIDPFEQVMINVAIINPAVNSSNWYEHPHSSKLFDPLDSDCRGKGRYTNNHSQLQ